MKIIINIKRSVLGILFLVLILLNHSVKAQGELLAKNFKYLYDPKAEIELKYQVVNLENRSQLYLRMTIRHNRTRIDDLTVNYASMDRFNGSLTFSPDTLQIKKYWINNIENQHYFNFEIANPAKMKILILRIKNRVTENEFYFSIPIDPDAKILNSGLILKLPNQNLPYFRNHVRQSEEFEIDNIKTRDSILYIYRYTDNFPAAMPPFSTNSDSIRRELNIDSVFSVKIRERINLPNPGLYFVQYDTSGVNGLSFRNESPFYPRETTYEELVQSLVYFSTNSEISRLNSTKNKKMAFDEYWLEVADSPDRAKRVIRDYYRRIRQANDLFTNYKQGWKTDKGMIYVVFGPPDVVNMDGKREEWIYERSTQLPRISFEFQKIESIFSDDHYLLIRKKTYQQVWYKAVDLWRKGQKEL